MHRGCQTPFSFLSEEQIAVCINKNKEAYLHIINYFIIRGFFFLIIDLHQLALILEFGLLITSALQSTKR